MTIAEILARLGTDAEARLFEEALRLAEALLFASREPLAADAIAERLPSGIGVEAVMEALEALYASRGVNLVKVAGKWAFRTAPDLAGLLVREQEEQKKLSRAALETLAVVAYHQPTTRAEIEDIRGISTAKGTLDVLLETGWVRMRGRRRAPGRPITYGTTAAFLEHFSLAALDDLPGLQELKGAGFFDAALPPGFSVPTPGDADALRPDEDPLTDEPLPLLDADLPEEGEAAAGIRRRLTPDVSSAVRDAAGWGQRGTAGATIPRSLAFEGVRLALGGASVLDGVDLAVAARDVVALLGPSGCGKTTLLRVAAGVEKPDAGRVLVDGVEVSGGRTWLPPERRGIGLVFQDYALFPHLSLVENVRFGLNALPAREARDTALRALARVGLASLADDYPHMISGGEQQRVALARAIAPRPGIILMDEPFSNLDRRLREELGEETMALIGETGATTVIVTHDPEEAMQFADRIALMRAGAIAQQGSAEDIYRRPADLFVARFFCDFNEVTGRTRGGRVDTPFGAMPAPGLVDGVEAVVCIRPQGVRLGPESAGRPARVVARKFLGEIELVTLAVQGMEHHMRARVRGGGGPTPGRDVGVTVDLEDVLVFPAANA